MVPQNQANYPAIKILSQDLTRVSILLAVVSVVRSCTVDHHFCTVMQMPRRPSGGVTAWVGSYSAEHCMCAVYALEGKFKFEVQK
jgi:hypothetical protein